MNLSLFFVVIWATGALSVQEKNMSTFFAPVDAGSVPAVPHEYDFFVNFIKKEIGHSCGSSILKVRDDINESDMLLTAAHCLNAFNKSDTGNIRAVAGNHYLNTADEPEQIRDIVDILIHDDRRYDIALAKLSSPIKFVPGKIGPVRLHNGEDDINKYNCSVPGYGYIEGLQLPEVLYHIGVKLWDETLCLKIWKHDSRGYYPEANFCASPSPDLPGSCKGDSGGPLICRGADGLWTAVGLVSYGHAVLCHERRLPSVFVKISQFLQWIQQGVDTMSTLVR